MIRDDVTCSAVARARHNNQAHSFNLNSIELVDYLVIKMAVS